LHLAIFDAITVTAMLRTSLLNPVRMLLCASIREKDEITRSVLNKFTNSFLPDIITLTEVGFNLQLMIEESLSSRYYLVHHANVSCSRNSEYNFFLLCKLHFKEPIEQPESGGFDVAELLMISVQNLQGVPFLIAAFHGQSSGSTSIRAAEVIWHRAQKEAAVVFAGMDANVVNREALQNTQFQGSTTFDEFNAALTRNGLATSSSNFDEESMDTCNKVRSLVNTQLQKAARRADWQHGLDKNPKDHTIFSQSQLQVLHAAKYNTPRSSDSYDQDLLFPSTIFPSDHALVYTQFEIRQ